MGVHRIPIMSVTQLLIIASAFALVATALPDVDSSTPEFELAEAQSTEASFTEAQSLMQEQGSNACNDLAKTTEDEVNNNIKREQDMLNKLDRGQNCKSKGDDVVSKAKNEKSQADSAYNQAVRNLNSAKTASVNFGQSRFGSIRKGDCSVFFNSGAYRNADNNVKNKQNVVNQKKGAKDAAAKAVDAAYKTKAKMGAECQCAVATNMDKMYSAASGRAKNSNQAAWTKAAHLRCVIKGTPANKCRVPAMRTLSKPSLQGGASKSKCVTLQCKVMTARSNAAGIVKPGAWGGATLTGGGLNNHYRQWNAKAGFENMYPDGNHSNCDMGFGHGQVTCYGIYCKKHGPLECTTRSIKYNGSGANRADMPSGYTMTGGGILNHYRSWNKHSAFEDSRPYSNGWYGDMGFGSGHYTVFVRGCKGVTCLTVQSKAGNSAIVNCPSGYTVTGCGMHHGNGCHGDSGFGAGVQITYARCCK